ncbi:hypothetical protein BJF83_20540 [Nocardiopsis sp. CNR-923]|uniref:hypothetical protein n=1 Tax=Nocardiopsis sp. CNR-923 TaxID=1904965 RepID=UPI00095F5B66|nr:hypothetical protein [Nocardiopsis sp. CNR-923]OLT26617.1 hypothetical protein BJF83_20540 [Nocardiopsis sp. CNR-923]
MWAGSRIEGSLVVDNTGTEDAQVELSLIPPKDMLATIEQETNLFPPGSTESDFTVLVEEGSGFGTGPLLVQAVDASGNPLTNSPSLTVTVRGEPGLLERNWPVVSVLLVLLVLAAAYTTLRMSQARAARSVQGLSAQLHRGDQALSPRLRAPSRWSPAFCFTVRDAESAFPRLEHAGTPGANLVYRATRIPAGVRLHPPKGRAQELRFGDRSASLVGGLAVSFHDARRPPGAPRAKERPRSDRGPLQAKPEDDGTGSRMDIRLD